MRRAILTAALSLALAAPAGAQGLTGFHSVLAQGQGTNATAEDVAANRATGAVPPEFVNQHAMYADLARAWPGLTREQFGRFFKNTDFGVAPGSPSRVDRPRPGVTIVRNPPFMVPRVEGATRADVTFGAGYAQAQDRLFLMDVLRRIARGSLSELIGPSGAAGDAATLTQQDFSEAELNAQVESLDERHGAEGAQGQADLRAFVAGINAFMDEVRDDPQRIPAEYPALGATPEPWTIADTAALATFLVSQFNVAGLGERANAAILEALQRRLGARRGRAAFDELRRLDDREAPTTADRTFRDDRPGRIRPAAIALPDRGSVKPRNALVGTAPAPVAAPPFVQGLLNLPRALPATKSNAVLVAGARSASGRPLASMGPQVGYFSPQVFSEIEMHGGGIDVQGVVFPGAAPYVLIGHGRRFAWSGTSPMSDLADTFVERLCDPEGDDVGDPAQATHYLYRGRCTPFVSREQVLTTPASPTDPTSQPRTIRMRTLRSVHGPVTHFATVDGDPVAITQQKTVDGREMDAMFAFARLNANQLTDAASFRRVWRDYPGGENWFYISDREVAWQLSGWMPIRARGVDPDLPTWGTGEWDWRGILPFERMPYSINPKKGYIISWNNKEAPGWRAPADTWTLGPTHRSLLLERRLRAELKRTSGKIDLAGLVRTTEAAALGDLEGQELLPLLRRLALPVATAEERALLDLLERWRANGAEHRDLNGDSVYEDDAAIALMRAWLPLLARRLYERALGDDVIELVDDETLSLQPGRSEFGGWHGQLQRSLRHALGRRVRAAPRELRCARGRRTSCARLVLAALRDAATVLRERHGGGPDRWRVPVEMQSIVTAGAIPTPRFPLQNRGTYHQVVELQPRR